MEPCWSRVQVGSQVARLEGGVLEVRLRRRRRARRRRSKHRRLASAMALAAAIAVPITALVAAPDVAVAIEVIAVATADVVMMAVIVWRLPRAGEVEVGKQLALRLDLLLRHARRDGSHLPREITR